MVLEINYSLYQEFCKKLPCKDVFYFVKSLFVQFSNDSNIYGIKYNFHSTPKKEYFQLVEKNKLEIMSLTDFLNGLPNSDNKIYIRDEYYRDKNILIIL